MGQDKLGPDFSAKERDKKSLAKSRKKREKKTKSEKSLVSFDKFKKFSHQLKGFQLPFFR